MATEQIPTSIIADDAVTGAKIENNPTVAGNLTVSGTTTATGALTASGGIANAGTITAGTLGSSVVFPANHMIFIKSQNRDGIGGSVGDHTSYFPTTTSDLATKSFYLSITSSEHAPFSKIKVDFNASCRIQESTHNFADYRLVRWTGTGNVSSETEIIMNTIGTAVDSPTENYFPMVGSAIDDISSVGSDQINYTIQYRNQGGNSTHSGVFYFGHSTGNKMQIFAVGII